MVGRPVRSRVAGLCILLLAATFALPAAAADVPAVVVSDQPGLLMPIGSTTTIGYKIVDPDGCAYSPSARATLDIFGSAGFSVFPYQISFAACDVFHYVNVTANALGTLSLVVAATEASGAYVDATSATIEVVVHVPNDPYPPILTTAPDQWAEAVGPAGARGLVWASAVDPVQGSISGARCTPPGPWFPINETGPGRTYVSCTVSDASGNIDTGGFWIQVDDTTPPVLPALSPQEVVALPDGVVRYATPPATDLVDLDVPLDCAPASGSRLPAGLHEVRCSATDKHLNTASGGSFVLVVRDLTSPTIEGEDIHVVASDPAGRAVAFDLSVHDGTDPAPLVACAPRASGDLFPVGTTRVMCTATDASGNAAATSFDVVVTLQGTSLPPPAPPSIAPHPDIINVATGPAGALVSYDAPLATAHTGAPLSVGCSPPSGSVFALGDTLVTCHATDALARTVLTSFTITVSLPPPPTIGARPALTLEATGPAGAFVQYAVPPAADGLGAELVVVCAPASGGTLPLGTTDVTCGATDAWGRSVLTMFPVLVQDTTPPALSLPADLSLSVAGAAPVSWDASALDLVSGARDVRCDPASGSVFALGTTQVSCTAIDAAGNRATATFRVTLLALPPIQNACNDDGWKPPVDTPGHTKTGINSFKRGSTVPLKIENDCSGEAFARTPRVSYARLALDGTAGAEKPGVSRSETADRFDRHGGHWQYNWDTRALSAGTYQLRVDVGDGNLYTKLVALV